MYVILKDVQPADVDKELQTEDGTALHLVVFVSSTGQLQGQYLAGDGCVSKVGGSTDLTAAVLVLILAYYVFDSIFPAEYAMLLATLQTFVMEEPYRQQSSQSFKFLVKKLRDIIGRMK